MSCTYKLISTRVQIIMCYGTNINFLLTVTAKVDVFVFALPLFFLKSFSISTLHIRVYSCSPRRVSRKLWTVYEIVSCIQQLRSRYALRTCYYACDWLGRQRQALNRSIMIYVNKLKITESQNM